MVNWQADSGLLVVKSQSHLEENSKYYNLQAHNQLCKQLTQNISISIEIDV